MRAGWSGFGMILAVAVAGSAHAQTTRDPYPPCTSAPSRVESEKAHDAYRVGKNAFDEGDYAIAVTNFKDAYRRDCTKPELLNFVARSYELEGNLPEAITALEAFVRRLAPNDPQADAAQKRVQVLRDRRAQQERTNVGAPAPVHASASSAASAPGSTPAPTVGAAPHAPVAPSSAAGLSVTPSSASAAAPSSAPSSGAASPVDGRGRGRGRHTVVPWIVTGFGAALVAVGVPLIVVGANRKASADDEARRAGCANGQCPGKPDAEVAPLNDRITGGATMANVGIGLTAGGAVVAAAGLVWHFLEGSTAPRRGGRFPTWARALLSSATPVCGAPGCAAVSMRGEF